MDRSGSSLVSHRAAPPSRFVLGLAIAVAAAAAALSVSHASASTLKLSCFGTGGRNADSAGTVLCAAPAGKSRIVRGRVLNDAGQPVAGTVTITKSLWAIATNGIGYTVKPVSTKTVTAKADGTFSILSNPATRESFTAEVVVAPQLGIATGASARADVHRQLTITILKLGGGAVRVTVRGTAPKNVKAQVTTAAGYAIPGQGAKRLDSTGKATFRLGARATGVYAIYVVRTALTDLFWASGKPPKFRLANGR